MKATSNIRSFELQMKKLAKLVPEDMVKVKRYIALDLYNEITLGNPVDTGYSHANWHIANGSPNVEVTNKPGRGAAVVPIPPPDLSALKDVNLSEPTYITNNVGYVKFLEEGTSRMAPRHFIARAVAIVAGRTAKYMRQAQEANT